MAIPATIGASIISEGFNNQDLQAFISDFYYTQNAAQEGASFEDMYHMIFSDNSKYREFLLYCKENNLSFVESGINEHVQKMLFLTLFEAIYSEVLSGVGRQIIDILRNQEGSFILDNLNEEIELTRVTYRSALLRSLYKKIPINSRGEVTYYLGEEYGLYKVFSHESGIHHVDDNGTVSLSFEKLSERRDESLYNIEQFEEILGIIGQSDYSDLDAEVFLVWKDIFIQDTGYVWSGTIQDTISFKIWLGEQLHNAWIDYRTVRDEDPRKPYLYIAGGRDYD